jgi:nitrate reductase gamma subunit
LASTFAPLPASSSTSSFPLIPVVTGAVVGSVLFVTLITLLYRRRTQRLKINAIKSLSDGSKNKQVSLTFINSVFYGLDIKSTR